MNNEKKLNVDISKSISEFRGFIKEFEMKLKLYKKLFRGKGIEFDSFRAYSSDDDASLIDWKASKRANKLLVKHYREEKNLKIFFAIDMSDNMLLGSGDKLKCEYSAEIIAALAYLVLSSKDKAGFLFFSDKVIEYFPPQMDEKQFHRAVDFLLNPKNYGGSSNFDSVLDFLINYITADGIFLISDFLGLKNSHENKIKLLPHKFETSCVMVRDILDISLPDVSGEYIIEDSSSGEQILINPRIAKREYEIFSAEQIKYLRNLFKSSNIDFIELFTTDSFVPKLAEFLKERARTR